MPEVNPEMLRWARESAGLPLASAAESLHIGRLRHTEAQDRLAAYERGDTQPSRPLLRKMAKKYRRPLLAFYLDHVPSANDSGQDFRTLPDGARTETDRLLAPLLRDLKARQGLLSSALSEDDDRQPLGFLGSLDRQLGPKRAARAIADLIGFNVADFSGYSEPKEAFKSLREKIEHTGVFVLLISDLGSWHSQIEVKTFRGIALVDTWAPFIVINANDAPAAWSFTALHELAHLMIGEGGVSGTVSSDSAIEQFCNNAASEILMPADQLATVTLPQPSDLEATIATISAVSSEHNVSKSLLAYRLYRDGRLTRDQWIALRDELTERWQNERQKTRQLNREKSGGPDGNVVRRYRLGASLRAATKEMFEEGQLSTSKAAMVLGVHPRRLSSMIEDNASSA